MNGGDSIGQVMAATASQTPQPPLAVRVGQLEGRVDEKDRQLVTTERIMGLLINEVQELRAQVGLQPLSPDYFNG